MVELLTREEVAKMLRISVRQFCKRRAAGKAPLPLKRPGEHPRWTRADVERWIERHKRGEV